jgi:hypothetical protein
MTYIQQNKILVALALLVLITFSVSLYTLTQVSKTKSAIEELATVLGQSRIVSQQDGKLIVNRVVTIADVQAVQGQPPM